MRLDKYYITTESFLSCYDAIASDAVGQSIDRLQRHGMRIRSFTIHRDQAFDTGNILFNGGIRLLKEGTTLPIHIEITRSDLCDMIADGTALDALTTMIKNHLFELTSSLIAYHRGYF